MDIIPEDNNEIIKEQLMQWNYKLPILTAIAQYFEEVIFEEWKGFGDASDFRTVNNYETFLRIILDTPNSVKVSIADASSSDEHRYGIKITVYSHINHNKIHITQYVNVRQVYGLVMLLGGVAEMHRAKMGNLDVVAIQKKYIKEISVGVKTNNELSIRWKMLFDVFIRNPKVPLDFDFYPTKLTTTYGNERMLHPLT